MSGGDALSGRVRTARLGDEKQLTDLWELLYGSAAPEADEPWRQHLRAWLAEHVSSADDVRIAVADIDGALVASAVGTVERGVPNPHSPTGLAVRVANVVTHPDHRRNGLASALVSDIITWANAIGADRLDLTATPDGARLYQRLGFTFAAAPRMNLQFAA